MSEGFHFDPDTHTYTVDGVRVPGVTDCCSLVDREYFGTEYSETGRLVHKLCVHVDQGTYRDDMTDDEDVKAKVRAWQQFVADAGFKPTLIERPLYSRRYRYAGTLDRLGTVATLKFYEKREGIFEIKSGSTVPKVVGLQTAGQAQLVIENIGYKQVPRFVVHLRPGQTPPYRIIPLKSESDFKVFRGLVLAARWKLANG